MKLLEMLTDESNRKTTMVLGLVIAMIVGLAVITYFFFYNNDNTSYAELPSNDEILAQQISQPAVDSVPNENIDSTNSQNIPAVDSQATNPAQNTADSDVAINLPQPVENISQPTANPAESQPIIASQDVNTTNTISSLKYTIKPLDMDIMTCDNERNGRWAMPKICEDLLLSSMQKLIETNADLIAIEVSGIVDNSPYAGPSAELKQEGLASFRAREAIGFIARNFSNVAVFEGPSKEQPNKRGFAVKAYYLQN